MVVVKRRGTPDRSQVPTLQDLFDGLDRSSHELQADSEDLVSHQTFSDWRKGDVRRFPKVETIQAGAATLGVDVTTLVLAFARTLGLEVDRESSRLETRLPPRAGDLTDRQVAAVVSVVDAMLNPADAPGLRVVARNKGDGKRGR